MLTKIETAIKKSMTGEMQKTALAFIDYLYEKKLIFHKDDSDCWKHKDYYWVLKNEECVCYIAIMDQDEPENAWTVWSDESSEYENADVSDEIRNIGWKHIDFCGKCGSCSGGKEKIVFGKRFPRVCGCTFRIDNADVSELPFLKSMVDIKMKEIE